MIGPSGTNPGPSMSKKISVPRIFARMALSPLLWNNAKATANDTSLVYPKYLLDCVNFIDSKGKLKLRAC